MEAARNQQGGQHFLLVAVSYCYLALMMTGLQNEGVVSAVTEQNVGISLDMNLHLNSEDS